MEKQKSAVLQMFYGQRGKGDKVKCVTEYREYADKAEEYYQALCKKLKGMPEALELLSNYIEWQERMYVVEIDSNYAEGFKFGLLIGIEASESKFE